MSQWKYVFCQVSYWKVWQTIRNDVDSELARQDQQYDVEIQVRKELVSKTSWLWKIGKKTKVLENIEVFFIPIFVIFLFEYD